MGKRVDWKTKRDAEWNVWRNDDGTTPHHDAQLCVLMDIREELKNINRVIQCYRFQQIPTTLKTIDKRLAKKIKLK